MTGGGKSRRSSGTVSVGPVAPDAGRASPAAGRRRLDVRQAILGAPKRLFLERGYSATSIEDVARAASVSKVAVYSHFGGKPELFAESVRAKCLDLGRRLDFAIDDAAPLRGGCPCSARPSRAFWATRRYYSSNDGLQARLRRTWRSDGASCPRARTPSGIGSRPCSSARGQPAS